MDYVSEEEPGAEKNMRAARQFFANREGELRRRQIGKLMEKLGRRADPRDFDEIAAFLEEARRPPARRRVAAPPSGPQEAWARFYHALFSSAEFRYRG